MADGRSGGVRGQLTQIRGKAQGLECEATALRSGQLNREYNTLDYNGDEDIALSEWVMDLKCLHAHLT